MNFETNNAVNALEPQQSILSKAEMTTLFLEAVKRFSKEYGDDLRVNLSIRFNPTTSFEVAIWQYIADKYLNNAFFTFYDFQTAADINRQFERLDKLFSAGEFKDIETLMLSGEGL